MTPRDCTRATPRVGRLLAVLGAVLAAILIAATAAAADPGDIVWRESSQRTPGSTDVYAALAVSPSGAVCAAGATSPTAATPGDVLVRAFGPDGAVRWRRVWTWPGRSDDTAAAVARDRRGACVVAGSSGSGWLLLKYSPAGYLQWVRRGHGGFSRASFVAVAVDGTGNVYAAGSAGTAGSGARLLVCKYSPTGALRWRRTVGADSGDASASALVLGSGDIYVSGRSGTGTDTSAALTVKYSAGGVRRWTQQFTPDAGGDARVTGAVYAGGPVICGWSGSSGGLARGFVVRYDATGTRLWTGDHAAGATDDRFTGVATDGAGHVCVTGTAVISGVPTALATCYDIAGATLWSLPCAGEQGLAICRAGDGFAAASGTSAFGVTQVTVAGSPVWARDLALADHSDFRPAGLQAAGADYLYAVGSAAVGGGGRAAVVVRYRP